MSNVKSYSWHYVPVGNAHQLLCNMFKFQLEERGFDVELEKLIGVDCGPRKYYKVDVYGKRSGETIMYECGYCDQEKLNWLRKNIGRTIHQPYLEPWFYGSEEYYFKMARGEL